MTVLSQIASASPPGPTFPRLRVGRKDSVCPGVVVLFEDARTGTIVHIPVASMYQVSGHARNWDAIDFEDFDGVVTLRNA